MGVSMRLQYFCAGRVAVMLLGLGLVLSSRLSAQGSTNASVLGTVTDASGAVIPKASVQVKNSATGRVQQGSADAQGRYTIADLPIGNYEAQASAPGFQTVVRPGITLTVGAQSVVDFSLAVGQAQQTVTVEGQVSQVDTVSAGVASYVEQKQINDLPLNGRNFTDLVTLAPGVSGGSQIGNGGGHPPSGVATDLTAFPAPPGGPTGSLGQTATVGGAARP